MVQQIIIKNKKIIVLTAVAQIEHNATRVSVGTKRLAHTDL